MITTTVDRSIQTLEQMYEKSLDFDSKKDDALAVATDLGFYPQEEGSSLDLALGFPPDLFGQMTPLPLTDWALQQVCNRLGPPPKRYISKCPGWLQAKNLNYWRDKLENDTQWLARIYDGRVRAILSEQYSPVDNSQVIKIVLDMLRADGLESQHSLTRPYVSPNDMFLRISLVELRNEMDVYEAGFFVGNGEIGNYTIRFAPYVKRNACDNSMIIMDKQGFSHQHRWRSPAWLRGTFKEMAGQMLGYTEHVLNDIVRCEMEQVPNLSNIIDRIVEDNNFTQVDGFRDNVLIGTEGQRTRMGLVNGISLAAHATPFLSEEQRTNMEMLAGAILASPDSLFGVLSRKNVDVEQIEE